MTFPSETPVKAPVEPLAALDEVIVKLDVLHDQFRVCLHDIREARKEARIERARARKEEKRRVKQ